MITHNLIQLLKAVALPEEYATARPKRLRFAVFTKFGRVIRHAGQVLLRIAKEGWKAVIGLGRHKLEAINWDTT